MAAMAPKFIGAGAIEWNPIGEVVPTANLSKREIQALIRFSKKARSKGLIYRSAVYYRAIGKLADALSVRDS